MQSLSRHRLSISRFHNKCHQDQGPQAPSPFSECLIRPLHYGCVGLRHPYAYQS